MKKHNEELEEKIRIEVLAGRIELLFGFCKDLIPDIDLLESAEKNTADMEQNSFSAAPLLGAAGIDYEEAALSWRIKNKRAEAIINLLKTLRDTEQERKDFEEMKKKHRLSTAEIRKMFGL